MKQRERNAIKRLLIEFAIDAKRVSFNDAPIDIYVKRIVEIADRAFADALIKSSKMGPLLDSVDLEIRGKK